MQDVNFAVAPGSTVAIVGKTGAGKSTLMNLLMRFYDPESGTITLDGKNIASVGRGELRWAMEIVLQDSHLFEGTVAENMRLVIKICFGKSTADVLTGMRAFSRRFVKTFPVLSSGFQLETEMTMHAMDKCMSIASVPVAYTEREKGNDSKLKTIPDGIRVLRAALRMMKDYVPLQFFGVLMILFFLAAGILFLPVYTEYIKTGLVPRLPTLVIVAALFIGGLICLSSGILLDSLSRFERRQFEVQLNFCEMMSRKPETGAASAEDQKTDESIG